MTFVSRCALAIGLAAFAGSALANDRICVRNYLKPDGVGDPCVTGLPGFVLVVDLEAPDERICTRSYQDSYCKNSPAEFDHALTPEGETVCVLDYHQPPISMSCATSPDLYQWVTAAYPD